MSILTIVRIYYRTYPKNVFLVRHGMPVPSFRIDTKMTMLNSAPKLYKTLLKLFVSAGENFFGKSFPQTRVPGMGVDIYRVQVPNSEDGSSCSLRQGCLSQDRI
jgi:hypothetical protein